jgi:sulfate transport system substrate-binding protein
VVTFTLLIWIGEHKNDGKPTVLIVYAFSTQKEVLTQGIFPAFEQFWESETGEDVDIEGIFGPSGNLSAQITLGAPADVAIFSNQRHIDWLKLGKCVDKDTNAVLFASTPMVILTRPGNPAGILDYADLVQPGIQLLHADPSSSGAGEWVVLAEYGSVYLKTGDPDTAESQLKNIWRNVRLMGSSARTTLTLFEMGVGDALVTYEQDAFFALQRGVAMEIIHPQSTILARHFAVIVDKNVSFVERPVVEAFLAYIQSDEGQQIFKQYYFRPSTLKSDLLPALDQTFTEEDLGGWTNAYDLLIEKTWKNEIKPGLQMEPVTAYLGGGE